MTMQLSTIDVSFDLTASLTTRSTTRDTMMDRYGIYKDVTYLQAMGGDNFQTKCALQSVLQWRDTMASHWTGHPWEA